MIRVKSPERQTRYRDRHAASVSDDSVTALWVRNESDRIAVSNGCWFDVSRGAFTVWWIERYCKLYEGDWAGEPLILRSGNAELDKQIDADWYSGGGRQQSIDRAMAYSEWVAAGNQPDWQYECTMRVFGWTRDSERWGRPIRRFNAAQVWVPKKQKKTPTAASWSVYLTCGDGEQGAKVFAGAKDGLQARLQMNHAMAMVEQSPELSIECKTNANESSITHLPTRSKFAPMSSANRQTEQSKEGLNGSMMIDEVHVVDRAFIRRISRMGISRSEPLRGEVSTAGNDPESYGKERQDYGRQVLAGAENNDRMFVAIYEADQKLTDDDLSSDPVKYGRMANPAWGHTAHEEEFVDDYNESKRTISGLADFKMYRLNVWQQVANAWLKGADWLACGDQWVEDEFRGYEASIGMDLSKTQDMSALTVTIDDDGLKRQKSWVFTTESFVRDNQDKANFRQWVRDGHLIEIPGNTIRNSFIKKQFAALTELFDVRCLVYDKTYAQDFVEWCEEEHAGVECVEFPQGYGTMARPIDDYEAAVVEREVSHDNNPCVNWQAGNCQSKDSDRGRLLAKPIRGDVRKIDAMVTSVMSYWGATALDIGKAQGSLFVTG